MATFANNQNFLYKPLDTRDFPIRILQVQPGDISDSLSCKLENYANATEQSWTCLSYTWGNEPPTREIMINGVTFPVRSNVYNFLQEARRRRLANLWIDSICINQSDVEERNSQVELMSRIFSEAKLVIVWLGQSSPALQRAVGLLDSRFPADTVSISLASAKAVCCQMSPAECTSLFKACGAAIWTRRWVKQEILLPRTTVLCCGQASVSISVFLAVMDALVDYSTLHSHALPVSRSSSSLRADVSGEQQDEPETCFFHHNDLDQRHCQCANVLPFYHAIRFMQGQIQLPILLEMFRNSVCTDFHDHVYAFRGLMDQGISLRVDYKLSNTDMFLNALDFVARTTHPQLRGTNAAERNFLVDLYRGFNLTVSDLEAIFESHHTSFLVQVGYSFEMLRKDVSVWVFADSITDPDEFVSSAWRTRELQGNCTKVLRDQQMHEYYTVLNQLRTEPDMSERGVWLYGLRSWCGPSLAGLRAVYSPDWFYRCRRETAQLLNSMIVQGYPARVMSFDPCGEDQELVDWLDEVKDQLVVMVTDRDDAAYQMQIFILPGCESEECLLQQPLGRTVEVRKDSKKMHDTWTGDQVF
ncbi:het-domain-containing protein [Fusarium mundagurra]|uniref:Het-domain-containing protein n=1 Tax=Fusarium mundagurra TaxID=1567541 RepID=A0A8H6D9Q6_9HYPO|nr:het-domain-containing protein [Fusarium mundagurra]